MTVLVWTVHDAVRIDPLEPVNDSEGVGPQALGPKAHSVVIRLVRLDFQRVCCLMLETDLICFFPT